MTRFVRFLFSLYRKLNLFPARCRFFPSCSCYTEEAIVRYGLFYGLFLALKRLIRCNQLFPGGFDPVP
ncbi:MAG: membrane protein insertion efficiency factor YidD [Candidatus Saganbacteria bacterium]|nr:membrane protein insertion efficiency factor YidD [Candidatus Saganbacteria bacterium]